MHSKLPHGLRLVIFFLRVVIGLDFFYLGWSTLFNVPLERTLRTRSLGDLYVWLAGGTSVPWLHTVAPWAFMVIGVCLVIGLGTRIVAILGVILAGTSYIPNITYPTVNIYEFVNNEVIVILCLLIIVAANAGKYLGADALFKFGRASKNKDA